MTAKELLIEILECNPDARPIAISMLKTDADFEMPELNNGCETVTFTELELAVFMKVAMCAGGAAMLHEIEQKA